MASIFKNNFFSVAGQKERIVNTGKVLGIATGLYNPDKAKIVSNTGNKAVDKVLSTAANHPYITAGVAAGGITAAKALPAVIATKGGAAAVGSVGSSGLKTLAIGAVGGAVLGGLFEKGSSANPNQNITPNQNNTQTTNTSQDTNYGDSYIDNSIRNIIKDSPYAGIGAIDQQNPFMQSPSQDIIPSFSPSQDIAADQTATASSGTNWLLVAAVIAGAYYLTNNNR